MKFSQRQEEIIKLVKEGQPITSENLAEKLGVTRAALRADDVMSKPVTVNENTMDYDAIVYLFLNDVGTLFVENNDVLVGAVSRKDFLKIAIGGTDIHKVPVGVIMTRMPNIICGSRDDSAIILAKKIIEHEIDSIPIVEKVKIDDGSREVIKIVGKMSKTNITKLFAGLGEEN